MKLKIILLMSILLFSSLNAATTGIEQLAITATTITFENTSVGSHPSIVSDGIQFSPVYNTSLIIRNSDTHALQPRWGDTLQIIKLDNSSFDLSSFDYQRQWPSASGTVQIIGYQSNGNLLQDSFSYDGSTSRTTKTLNWTELNEVELVFQGTAQLDNFVIGSNGEPPSPSSTVDFEEVAVGTHATITSQGMFFQPVFNTALIIRDSETHAVQPRWNDTMQLNKDDGGLFDLQSFDYRSQWASASGNVQVIGYRSDGAILRDSFTYNGNTTTTTLSPGWTSLNLVEIVLQGTVQLDNFVIGSQGGTDPAYDYYVATDGSDANPGSKNSPFASITYASTQTQPGDIVFIKAGVYHEQVRIQRSGTAAQPVTYLGESGAIVDGSTLDVRGGDNDGLLIMSNKSHIILDGITVRHSNHHGIAVNAGNNNGSISNITIRNCRTNRTDGSGIIVYGAYPFIRYQVSDITIENNEVFRPQQGRFNGNNRWHEDITVGGGVENFVISGNHVNAFNTIPDLWDGGPLGIDAKDGVRNGAIYDNHVENIPSGGIYVDAGKDGASNIDVYRNNVHDTTGYGIQISGEEGGQVNTMDIYNNIVYNTRWSGIVVDSYTRGNPLPAPGPKMNINIFNNTIFNTGFASTYSGGIRLDQQVSSGSVFNNIIATDTPLRLHPDYVVTHNCIDGNLNETGETGQNPILGNPAFVNASSANFHLQAASPCIDTGRTQGAPDDDFDGNTRPRGNGYDIGAFEF